MFKKTSIITHNNVGGLSSTLSLHSPSVLPNACGYLWNSNMVAQVNCRGYMVSQFMQPEPSKYSHGPSLEAKTFIQPEHPYFSHHPGRFFYIKDHDTNEVFSAPYEPMRVKLDRFEFKLANSEISWEIEHLDLAITIIMSLTEKDCVERWSVKVKNLSSSTRNISIYPYFSIGYMSWMNQSAQYEPSLKSIVANSITPYQKVEQYFENQDLKDKTFLAANKTPTSWLSSQNQFEGLGGLHNPDALLTQELSKQDARFETPVAVMQFKEAITEKGELDYQFIFGPAKDHDEIETLTKKYLPQEKSEQATKEYADYVAQGSGCLTLDSDNEALNDFVNHWLPRQMFYHGDINRLSSDPQTRNYIQDNMGMCFIRPETTKQAFLLALSQQTSNGAMPDGILLHEKAELKYINQVPHSDHCVWLPICLSVYLGETGDLDFLDTLIPFGDDAKPQSVIKHIELSLDWLLQARDHRGLSYIEQGDWCDPMNMVGYKGKGVSAWLSLATAYAINCWCDIAQQYELSIDQQKIENYRQSAIELNDAVNTHLYIDKWFARGITDGGRVFGTDQDAEGKIFLNPQSWAMLSGAATKQQSPQLVAEIDKQLMTPYGVMMLAPSYTSMVEDIGRVTQKHPGVSENGSVYNHAAIFYAYSLFQKDNADKAFEVLDKMLPSHERSIKTGQMPNYIPNYYRGAYHQHQEQAGRSSHLFNTGTISWFYRCIVEELCGLKGSAKGLIVNPKLPASMKRLAGQRDYRGAIIDFMIIKKKNLSATEIVLDGEVVKGNILPELEKGQSYSLLIHLSEDD